MSDLRIKLILDAKISLDEITKITYGNFEMDRNKVFELMENFKGNERDFLDDFIFWGKDFKVIVKIDDDLFFEKISFKQPTIIEKIIPDNLIRTFTHEAKDGMFYSLPFESEELKKEKEIQNAKRIEQERKEREREEAYAISFYEAFETHILSNENLKYLEDFSILRDKKRPNNRYIIIPEDFPLYEEKSFYKELLGKDLYNVIDFYGYTYSKDNKFILSLFKCDGLFGTIFYAADRRNDMIKNLLDNKKIFKTIGFSFDYIPDNLKDISNDEIIEQILIKLKNRGDF